MKVTIDYSKIVGKVKPMNAVNNGPVVFKQPYMAPGNLQLFKEANIPYARTHDASFCPFYGGEHTVDVHLIFRDFNADPYDPASYDFCLTDEYMENICASGAEVFYRLGAKIEHESVKYGTVPPPDFHKWAVICEHIIAHLNEGWANGHHFGIKYWEIWNEPNELGAGISTTWGGTMEQFFDLYEITAKHLKEKFPYIKIGGAAFDCVDMVKLKPFLQRAKDKNIPVDFLSWHCYTSHVGKMSGDSKVVRELLDSYGFTETESILNEWNYVKSFCGEEWIYSLKTEKNMKGAAYVAGVMSACQDVPLDMLMYYDARPCAMNGLFEDGTFLPFKAYYAIKAWGELLALGTQCAARSEIPDVYVTAAKGKTGELAMIVYYTDDDTAVPQTFPVSVEKDGMYGIYLLDEAHDMEKVEKVFVEKGIFYLTMKPNTVIILRQEEDTVLKTEETAKSIT